MNTEDIIGIHDQEEPLTTGEWFHGKNASGNIVLAQAGLGDDAHSLKLITSIKNVVAQEGNYSLLVLHHPHHDKNSHGPGNPDFTLALCREASQAAISILLQNNDVKRIIPVGYSMGFWSLTQAIASMNNLDPKIRIILGKSGIFSYDEILLRHLKERGYEDDEQGAWERLFSDFNLDPTTGLGNMPILPGQPPVKIHKNFLTSIPRLNEREIVGLPMRLWHGEEDNWTLASHVQSVSDKPNIQATIISKRGHNLRPNNTVDLEILDAIDEDFSS